MTEGTVGTAGYPLEETFLTAQGWTADDGQAVWYFLCLRQIDFLKMNKILYIQCLYDPSP